MLGKILAVNFGNGPLGEAVVRVGQFARGLTRPPQRFGDGETEAALQRQFRGLTESEAVTTRGVFTRRATTLVGLDGILDFNLPLVLANPRHEGHQTALAVVRGAAETRPAYYRLESYFAQELMSGEMQHETVAQIVLAVGADKIGELMAAIERFAGPCFFMIENRSVENWGNKNLMKRLPQYFEKAARVGITNDKAFDLLMTMLGAASVHTNVGTEQLPRLEVAWESFPENYFADEEAFGHLKNIIVVAAESGLVPNALYNLGFAVLAGLSLKQINHLFAKIQDNEGSFGTYTYQHLQVLLKRMAAYHVDPQIAFEALDAIFSFSVGQWQSHLTDLALAIEMDVLGLRQSPNTTLAMVPEIARPFLESGHGLDFLQALSRALQLKAQKFSQARAVALSGSAESLSPTMRTDGGAFFDAKYPDFPLLTGDLRHANLPYMLHKSYEAGLEDLRRLCLDETLITEGAFIFDPDSETWFCLGGQTTADWIERRLRTEFSEPDMGRFGPRPKFIHIHPQQGEFITEISWRDMSYPKLAGGVNGFIAFMPSRADLRLFAELTEKSSRPVDVEFVIVHRGGQTVIKLLEEPLVVKEFAVGFRDLKDLVLIAPDQNIDYLLESGTTNADVIEYLYGRLGNELRGVVRIDLDVSRLEE